MTQEYKNDLLAYMTGTIENQERIDEFIFHPTAIKENNIENILRTDLGMSETDDPFQYVDGTTYGHNGMFVIYGTYNNKGFFCLLDKDYNHIYTINDSYSVRCLTPIEGNRYVGLNGNYFVYFTDFTEQYGTYSIKKQATYTLPSKNLPVSAITGLRKMGGEAIYAFWGNYNGMKATVFSIGQAFEENYVELKTNASTNYYPTDIDIFKNNDDEYTIHMYGSGVGGYTSYYFTWNGETPSDPYEVKNMSGRLIRVEGCETIDWSGNYGTLLELNSNYARVWEMGYDKPLLEIPSGASTSKCFTYKNIYGFQTSINGIKTYIIGLIGGTGRKKYTSFVTINASTEDTEPIIVNAKTVYKLSDIIIQRRNSWYKQQIVHGYGDEYNGNSYTKIGYSFVPKDVVIKNDEEILFARDIFNYSQFNNQITSSVEVPNTMLNDTLLTNNVLRNTTNIDLVEDQRNITKNIYETLNLNYINSIVIQNKNIITQPITMQEASNKLTDSIVDTSYSYEDTKLGKVTIYFSSGTPYKEYDITSIENFGSYALINFSFLCVGKPVLLELQSAEGTRFTRFNYMTLNLQDEKVLEMLGITEFKIGKIYNFTQHVEVE